MKLLTSFCFEILKTRRTATFYLTLIAAALVPIIFLLDLIVDGVSTDNRKDPLNSIFREGNNILSILILPMFIVLVCTMLPQIEFRNNTWKQVFASPQKMRDIFIARFLNVHFLILLFFVSYNVFMVVPVVAIHFMDPALDLLNQPLKWSSLLKYNINGYIAVLAISAIQFWIGLRFRNFILPVAIGFVLWVIGSLMVMEFHTQNAHFFPYTYLIYTCIPKYESLLPTVQLGSVGYTAFFLLAGFFDFSRRKVK